ncbi:DUF6959 family protein [Actinoplanes aureus]|uniref:Uncharacterized protein n=1 Tax=Actinoplanes aureus TaxID=2792083 RepID=A0A931CG22_9ACTN|nr:hypothetical protein [Actinoplanes aureus]MBG0569255.1 hypothetical protein [Actinoplanes aureus]
MGSGQGIGKYGIDSPGLTNALLSAFSVPLGAGDRLGWLPGEAKWDHRRVSDEQGQVLAIGGNVAVTQLIGREFPGLHIQGDTFANLQHQVADVARRIRRDPSDGEALDDLDYVVDEMTQLLQFYEAVLAEREINLPYVREGSS